MIFCVKPVHLSWAINVKDDYFITVDDGILKYKNNTITILNPIDFIKHWEKSGGVNDRSSFDENKIFYSC